MSFKMLQYQKRKEKEIEKEKDQDTLIEQSDIIRLGCAL